MRQKHRKKCLILQAFRKEFHLSTAVFRMKVVHHSHESFSCAVSPLPNTTWSQTRSSVGRSFVIAVIEPHLSGADVPTIVRGKAPTSCWDCAGCGKWAGDEKFHIEIPALQGIETARRTSWGV
jgi:hypothetical protein